MSDGYEAGFVNAKKTIARKTESRNGLGNALKWLGILGGSLVGFALLSVALISVHRGAGPGILRTQCKNNFRHIALALWNYQSKYGSMPPAFTVDEAGKPLHSWRTLILPFLDQQELYDKIDLSKAWDDPANALARATPQNAFSCMSAKVSENQATYLAVVGDNACFRPGEPRRLAEITDKRADTLLIIEVPPGSAVRWMSPMDADEALILSIRPETKTAHPGGMNAMMAEGSVRFLSTTLSDAQRRALISINGNDSAGDY